MSFDMMMILAVGGVLVAVAAYATGYAVAMRRSKDVLESLVDLIFAMLDALEQDDEGEESEA